MDLRAAGPAAFVAVTAITAWLITGVSAGDVALFVGHELAFVLVPGCALWATLSRQRRSRLELAGAGYALGSVLEVLAFALTAALGVRVALWGYPPLSVAVAAAVARVDRRGLPDAFRATAATGRDDLRVSCALAGVCAVAIAYIVVAYFLFEPLPGSAGSVVYIPDLVFHLGVAADALHHWPIADPKVAGVALPYETFIYMKLAATSQLTHVALPTLLFRLYVLPLMIALIALLSAAGERIAGRRGVGVLAAGLFVFVGQLGLDPHDLFVFFNTVFFSLYDSPTYLLGLVLFLATLVVLHEQIHESPADRRGWLLLGILLVGCAGAKAAILPVLLGGLVLYVGWLWARGRTLAPAAVALALTVAVFAITYLVIYRSESGGLKLNPPGSIREMSAITYLEGQVAGVIGHPLFWVLATVLGVVGFAGPTLAGLPAVLASRAVRRRPGSVLLVALLVASLVPFLLLTHKGGSQNFFAYYGVCAACILSAEGLVVMWERVQPISGSVALKLALALPAWVAALTASAVLPYTFARNPSIGPLYALWIGVPALVAIALLAAAARWRQRRRLLQLLAVGSVAAVGLLDTPLHTGAFVVPRVRAGETLYRPDSPQARGLTPGLQQALAWVRSHTPVSAVIAVNNQYSDSAQRSADYYYYSAFGERRVFLDGWEDTIADASIEDPAVTPFPARFWLNTAVFGAADRAALRVMRDRYGVRYLFVDRIHGRVDPRLAALGRVVFNSPSAIVYQVGRS